MCLFCTKSKPKAKAVLLNKPVVDQNGASYVKPASVPAVIKVRSASEFKAALDSAGDKNVVVDFYATWCGPCKRTGPVYQGLAKKYEGKCVALSIDVDELEEVAEKCGIKAMPTFHLYRNGNKVTEFVGAPQKDQLEGLFTQD